MAKLLKKKIKTKSHIDQVKKAVKIMCLLNNTTISDTESVILTHFVLEGFNKVSRDEILEQKLVKNYNNLANIISSLRKRGLIVKEGFREDLSSDLSCLRNCTDKLVLMLMLDNSAK